MAEFFFFQDIYYKFPQSYRYIKESGTLSPGSLLILQGSSGVGKSTLLKLLARLIKAEGGEVVFRGERWDSYLANEWRLNIQYVPQQPITFEGTVEENLFLPFQLKMVADNCKTPSLDTVNKYINSLGLSEDILKQAARTLSGGEKARIAIIRAILLDPSILLLDEPSAYLDEISRERTMKLLDDWVSDGERAIIMVSHNVADLEYISNYSVLDLTAREE